MHVVLRVLKTWKNNTSIVHIMKTAYFAFVVLGLLAAQASAQSSVNLYGILDAGVVDERGCDGCKVSKVSGGMASGSRVGIHGREALGHEAVAVFTLEAGVQNDTGRSDQNGTLFGRQAFVGIDSKLGALTVGRQYSLQYAALTEVADPFQGGMAGSASNLVGYSSKRYDNTLRYATPSFSGVSAAALYSFGEAPNNNYINRAYGAMLGYADGPIALRIAHQRKNNFIQANGTTPAVDTSARNTLVAANFNLGIGTAYAGYGQNRGDARQPWDADNPYGAVAQSSNSTNSRDLLVGVAMPRGATTLMASFIHKNDRDLDNQDANQVAIGISYSVSKRTGFYAAYAKIRNRNNAAYTVGNASSPGGGDSAFNLGLRHAF